MTAFREKDLRGQSHVGITVRDLDASIYSSPESQTRATLLSHSVGASHVAFQVDDIEAKKAELETRPSAAGGEGS